MDKKRQKQAKALPRIYREEMRKLQKAYGLLLPPTVPSGFLFETKCNEIEFDRRFHTKLIAELLSYGMSLTAAAGYMGITLHKLVAWRKKHPLFDEACEHGENLARGWWEELGRRNILNKNFNTKMFQLYMTNQYGWVNGEKAIDLKQDINLEVTSKVTAEPIQPEYNPKETVEVMNILKKAGVEITDLEPKDSTEVN